MRTRFAWALLALGIVIAAVLAPARSSSKARELPAIVFVSRMPSPAPGVIPGLGPAGRGAVAGGRLRVREPDGRVRDLVRAETFADVSAPSVSPDAKHVAFAATVNPDSAWRIYVVRADGESLRAVTRSDRVLDLSPLGAAASRFARYDDFDPCWVDRATLCFASTRYPQRSQYGDFPVSNIFLVSIDRGAPRRITSERNGAEKPAYDARHGKILFARWWHNRYMPGDSASSIVVSAGAQPVSLWQAMEIEPDGAHERIACGAPATRIAAMAYQPAPLADGSIVGVYARNLSLVPGTGGVGIQRFAPPLSAGVRIAGAIREAAVAAGYGSSNGLAPASACSPAGLPDGRLVFAYDPGGRGDFDLWIANKDASGMEALLTIPGTLELDPAPLVAWDDRRRSGGGTAIAGADLPFTGIEQLKETTRRFRFLNENVFSAAHGASAPPQVAGARILFWGTLARPAAEGGDTAVLVREAPVGPGGRVDVNDLPAGLPMFEQLVDSHGSVLRSAHATAHVAGLNVGLPGQVTRCIGCHTGHSVRLAPR